MIDPIEAEVLTLPDRPLEPKRPPMVVGGTFQGTGAQLTIWATEYNKHIAANRTPRYAAKKAARRMLITCTMHDLGQLGYFAALADDPGAPSGFSFQPGQLFPLPSGGVIPADVFTGLDIAIAIVSKIPAEWAQIVGLVLELIELILDIVNFIAGLFAGKPVYVDTLTVAQRFLSGLNPASFVPGVQLLRNMSQNSIYLSSSDPADQTILGNIRRQAEEMIVAQGQLTATEAKDLIDLVWGSANDSSFELPQYLKQPPPTPGSGSGGGGGGGGQGPCPPYATLPDCLPTAPAPDPDNDTPGDLIAALSYWLSIIAIYLMNIYQAIAAAPSGGGGGESSPDPVTCKQLTGLVGEVNGQLAAIAEAISTESGGGGGESPIDLSHVNKWADQETDDETATAANLAELDTQLASDLAAKLQTT